MGKGIFGMPQNVNKINKDIIPIDIKNLNYLTRLKTYSSIESNSNLDEVIINTSHFDGSKIIGEWKDVSLKLNTVSFIYKDFVFTNCHFKNKSWIDGCIFNRCTFTNCIIEGDVRWVDFLNCKFDNVQFNLNYFRASKIDKNAS